MKNGYRMVRDAVRQCPLPLLSLKEEKLIKVANDMFPYSIGIEVEVNTKSISDLIYDIQRLNLIRCDQDPCEVRFRTKTGIQGFIDVYNICELLKKHCLFNPESGIHYHVDFTDRPDIINSLTNNWHLRDFLFKKKVCPALESWNYKGSFNRKEMDWTKGSWVSVRSSFNTLEYRIGEMTFDYELMIKRIIHLQNINRAIKSSSL